jgi:hypothetical protein
MFCSVHTRASSTTQKREANERIEDDAIAWPSVGGDREGLLRGFLSEVEVAEGAERGGQDAAPLLAEDLIERRYQYTSEGRISTAPP